MALSMEKVVQDTASFAKALVEYLGLKNKVLYSGSTRWESGSKTISGISKYNTIKVYLWSGYGGIELERVGTTFQGDGMVANVSPGNHTDVALILNFTDKDLVTIGANSVLHHQGASSHVKFIDGWVLKIVGVEPIIPDALAEYIRGGYCVRLGGGLHVVIKEVLAGYRQRMAENFCWCADRQPENRAAVDPVGKHVFKNDSHYRNKKYNISNSIQRKTNSDWPVYRFNSIPRLVQYYRVQHTKHVFHHGVQEQSQHLLHISRSLACNRQSITPRGCCYV